jgi:hypothetical protein
MSFKQVHMAALAAALLAGTAGFAYAQSSTPSTAPTKPGVSSQAGPAHGATTGAASEEMKKGDTAKDAPKAGSPKGDAAKTESKGEASKTEKEGKSSETMGGKTNAKAETSPDGAKAKAADGKTDTMNKADTTGKGANDSAPRLRPRPVRCCALRGRWARSMRSPP